MLSLPRRFALAAAVVLAACPGAVPYVCVPEACYRAELAGQRRIALPLDAEGRSLLRQYLLAGGNTREYGVDVVDPDADRHYGALLDRLADPRFLALEDLTERTTFDDWFRGKRVRRVVDARNASPPPLPLPVAATDGRYWWIFFAQGHQLKELLVVATVTQDSPN